MPAMESSLQSRKKNKKKKRSRQQGFLVTTAVLGATGALTTTFLGLRWVEQHAFTNKATTTTRAEYTSLFPVVVPLRNSNNNNDNVTTTTTTTTSPQLRQHVQRRPPCPFASSSLRHKIYVYPDYDSTTWRKQQQQQQASSILSHAGRNQQSLPWPWLATDRQARAAGTGHYHPTGPFAQYTTELLIQTLLQHESSWCLRTSNPEQATRFFVPYLSSTEYHDGKAWIHQVNVTPSPFGAAIRRILEHDDYSAWEDTWGLTSKYWKRRGGADHILVFSEPLHGLWHEGNKRGNFQYIHTQQQLAPPIIVSVELSKTFVEQYPRCAAKNILLPYPNPDGRWYNGYYDRQVQQRLLELNISTTSSPAALPVERLQPTKDQRIASDFYYALSHGTCVTLRKALMWNYRQCSKASTLFSKSFPKFEYPQNMRLATFCPCPGGDSPSAKRMFDAILAGCIPVVLSRDFLWPFTTDVDPSSSLSSSDFALHLPAQDYTKRVAVGSCREASMMNATTRKPNNHFPPESILSTLMQINAGELSRLRRGMEAVRDSYAWYRFDTTIPGNPLRERILPDGGIAHAFVRELEVRAKGQRWLDCQAELKSSTNNMSGHGQKVNQFKC